MDDRRPARTVVERCLPMLEAVPRIIVGLGGPVAVGKSTLASTLVDEFGVEGITAHAIGTDGFLFSNDVLTRLGAIDRKGEPDTYDESLLGAFLVQARTATGPVPVPTYSHVSFDVGDSEMRSFGSVVIVEGVNALQPSLCPHYDLTVYLDADPSTIEDWYVDRFLRLIEAAEHDTASFYRRFVELDAEGRMAMARWVWSTINLPNLIRFIAPTKNHADMVVTLRKDHSLDDPHSSDHEIT